MAQSYLPQQQDTRTFGVMQTRLLDDLNRPDLANIVIDYLQDAMRYYQRMAFFFSEIDNTQVPTWQAGAMYPLGSTIYRVVGTTPYPYAFVAMSTGVQQSGDTEPDWTDEQFLNWGGSEFYQPPLPDTPGITEDNDVLWANIGPYQPGYHTQLTTVPNVNQYIPPIDYTMPYMVQITTANLRLILEQLPFVELSSYDVIRPAPIAAYPRFWAWWQQLIYLWVYPLGFFPITLNYNTGPNLVVNSSDSNYWTTTAERLIRKSAQAAISREILYDQAAAQLAMSAVSEELSRLKSQAVAQLGYRIPAWGW
jgi:hypothetical protein